MIGIFKRRRMRDCEDRVAGVLLGLAAGDRIGGPIRMALRVAESLRDRGGFDVTDIGARYLDWWQQGAFDTGPTVGQVLSLVTRGDSFEHASLKVDETLGGMSAGCNPAHRSAPLAMCVLIPDSALNSAAKVEARLTHQHPLAGEVAAVVVSLCRALIRGSSWPDALALAADGQEEDIMRALRMHHCGALSCEGFAPEVLRAAIYFLDSSGSFSTALERSIAYAGPDNYCPVLVGSIGGARWGAIKVGENRICHHRELLPSLKMQAFELAKGWRNGDAVRELVSDYHQR